MELIIISDTVYTGCRAAHDKSLTVNCFRAYLWHIDTNFKIFQWRPVYHRCFLFCFFICHLYLSLSSFGSANVRHVHWALSPHIMSRHALTSDWLQVCFGTGPDFKVNIWRNQLTKNFTFKTDTLNIVHYTTIKSLSHVAFRKPALWDRQTNTYASQEGLNNSQEPTQLQEATYRSLSILSLLLEHNRHRTCVTLLYPWVYWSHNSHFSAIYSLPHKAFEGVHRKEASGHQLQLAYWNPQTHKHTRTQYCLWQPYRCVCVCMCICPCM